MRVLCILRTVSLRKPLQSQCICMCLCALYVNFPILFQKLRTKGHSDCASPDPDDCFGHSPLMDDRLGKLNEESDLIYKRSGVSTAFSSAVFCWFLFLCWYSLQALNKKEHRGCDSPDPDASYVLTPHTEEKYKKINEEFDNMMRNHKIVSKCNIFAWLCGRKDAPSLFCFFFFFFFFFSPTPSLLHPTTSVHNFDAVLFKY